MKARLTAVAALAALAAVPAAEAKTRLWLQLSAPRPAVGQPVQAIVRSEVPLGNVRLYALAPGVELYAAALALERGDARPRQGFVVPLVADGKTAWRATVRFPRSGRWRLVVPNWDAPGIAIPPPVIRPLVVDRVPPPRPPLVELFP